MHSGREHDSRPRARLFYRPRPTLELDTGRGLTLGKFLLRVCCICLTSLPLGVLFAASVICPCSQVCVFPSLQVRFCKYCMPCGQNRDLVHLRCGKAHEFAVTKSPYRCFLPPLVAGLLVALVPECCWAHYDFSVLHGENNTSQASPRTPTQHTFQPQEAVQP